MERLLGLLLCLCFPALVLGGFRRNYVGTLNKGLSKDFRASLDPMWFTGQKVDHFDNSNTGTWQQKYYVNDTFWKVGNPIFLVLGGEGPISAAYVGDRFVAGVYAPQFGAMIIGLEHRFYGDSMPTADSSVASLKLLSSEQALADAALFRQNYTAVLNSPQSKWIVFGGSYSGALSAWARSKYPYLFQGSWASSGPVNAVEDFNQYLQVVANSLGTNCSAIIQQATNTMDTLLTTQDGRTQLQATFNTCTAIQYEQDSQTFLETITDAIAEVVQYNKDNNGGTNPTIDQLCAIFQNGQSDPVSAWATAYHQIMGPDCVEVSYEQTLKDLEPTSAGRCWTWQTCTEFGYYQTGELPTQPFSSSISLDYFRGICQDAFGPLPVSPDTNWVNTNFGSLDLKLTATNTWFGDGTIDPWHALAILPKNNQTGQEVLPTNSAVYLINGTAHCADLYAPSPNDLPDLTNARSLALSLLTKWLSD